MAAAYYPIQVTRGAAWSDLWTVYGPDGGPVDLTGWTALLTAGPPGQPPVLTMTEVSGLALGGAAGTVAPSLSGAQTAAVPRGSYLYSLLLTPPSGAAQGPLWGPMVFS